MSHIKQPSLLTRQVLLDGFIYFLKGRFFQRRAHLPRENHAIAPDFIGIGVATNAEAVTDDYVVAQLNLLGIKRVRLDVADDEMYIHQCRLLERLCQEGFSVDVHLVQSFDAARKMLKITQQQLWQEFVSKFLQQYASDIASIEVGNAINRKRWAGYHWPGFMQMWQITHILAKQHGVTLIGPNIQDFEPLYNVSLLKALSAKNQLPDRHSNNLFAERVIEPEQPDHRIFKFRWTRIFNFNLLKKARLLEQIARDHQVSCTVSPVAFWSMLRIQRHLPDGEQKQADYLTRYFVLMAASGAFQHANWGALICTREGVIDDAMGEGSYPDLERVAYYKSTHGDWQQYMHRPAFDALKTVAYWLNGAQYIGPVATGRGLEIHHIQHHGKQVHVAWTINGKSAEIIKIYETVSLDQVSCLDRDGQTIDLPQLITEKPVYLLWDNAAVIVTQMQNLSLSSTFVDGHIRHKTYFPIEDGDWRAMFLAENAEHAALLWQALHPERLTPPAKAQALRHARNVIWSIPDPQGSGLKLTVKKPVRMYLHKQYFDRFKPSKGKRSWNGAMALMRRGIDTAMPIAYIEHKQDKSLRKNFYICEFVPHAFPISEAFLAFRRGETQFYNVSHEYLFASFASFCKHLHDRGIYFRDFSGGNILVQVLPDKLKFVLIDTARLREFATATPFQLHLADLTRALHKLDWNGRMRFLQIYMQMYNRPLDWSIRWPFYRYDLKVKLKHTIGRRGIQNLLRKIKSIVQ